MEEMNEISIIIPYHNAEMYIEKCINSALSQNVDKQIICVDDCSDDNTSAVIKRMMEYTPSIQVVKNDKNIGAGLSRNVGMDHADGEFICFLDADDYYPDKGCLCELIRQANENQVNISGGLRYWDCDGELIEHPLHRKLISDNPEGVKIRFSDYQEDYHFHSYIYRRKMISDNNIRFPGYSRYEDPVFFTKAMVLSDFFYVIPREVYCYRKHNNMSNINVEDLLRGIEDVATIAHNYQLNKLKNVLTKRIQREYFECIKHSLEIDNKTIVRLKRLEELLEVDLISCFIEKK